MSDARSVYNNGMTQGLMPFRGQLISEQEPIHDATLSAWKERMCYVNDDAYVTMCERKEVNAARPPDAL